MLFPIHDHLVANNVLEQKLQIGKVSETKLTCFLGPVWPDLAKFRHLCEFLKGEKFKVRVYLVLGKLFDPNMKFFMQLDILLDHNMNFLQLGKFYLLKLAKYWTSNLTF